MRGAGLVRDPRAMFADSGNPRGSENRSNDTDSRHQNLRFFRVRLVTWWRGPQILCRYRGYSARTCSTHAGSGPTNIAAFVEDSGGVAVKSIKPGSVFVIGFVLRSDKYCSQLPLSVPVSSASIRGNLVGGAQAPVRVSAARTETWCDTYIFLSRTLISRAWLTLL